MRNRTFILRDHSHITETVILFTGYPSWPLSQKEHETIDSLEKISDLHFVFTETSTTGIDPKKFSELYQATKFSISLDPTGISGLLWAIDYDRAFWPGQHLHWSVILGEHLDNVDPSNVRKMIEASELIKSSVFEVKRYSSEDLYNFYKIPETGFRAIFQTPQILDTYTTHTVSPEESWVVLKKEFMDEIITYRTDHPRYIGTFRDPWSFLGSISKRLEKTDLVLNQNPDNVKISTNRV